MLWRQAAVGDKLGRNLPGGPLQSVLNAGDTAWMLISTALVLFMIPGLALFYGGLARSKNMLGTMMHSLITMGVITLQWVAFGYSLAFSGGNGFIGDLK